MLRMLVSFSTLILYSQLFMVYHLGNINLPFKIMWEFYLFNQLPSVIFTMGSLVANNLLSIVIRALSSI